MLTLSGGPWAEQAAATSALPLKDGAGRTFGVLLSLAPALPDPFVQMMCRVAGPALERAWKRERAERLLSGACEWLQRTRLRLQPQTSSRTAARAPAPEQPQSSRAAPAPRE